MQQFLNSSTLILLMLLKNIVINSMELSPVPQVNNYGEYVFVQKGNLPLLITVPHGGSKEIGRIRTQGVTKKDLRTLELAHEINENFQTRWHKKPFIVAALFSRKSIDANRSPIDAFEDKQLAAIYNKYHESIEQCIQDLKTTHPHGALLLDIHGQSQEPLVIHRGTQNGITTKRLIGGYGTNALSGPQSICGLLAKKGYNVFPPINQTNDILEYSPYSGGFTVREYNGTQMDAIQIEVGSELREKAELRKQFAGDFACAIMTSLNNFYMQK